MSDFKKQVRIELIQKGMTMKDLADEMGITNSYLSDLLNGKRNNQAQLNKIKDLLDLDIEEDGENEQ